MDSIITLVLILAPMFVGFLLPVHQQLAHWSEKILNGLVFLILTIIGMELAAVDNLGKTLMQVALYLPVLLILNIGSGLIALYLFDKFSPCPYRKLNAHTPKTSISLHGSFVQLGCLVLGFLLASMLPDGVHLPAMTTTVLLMILLLLVGILLKNSNVSLKQALFNQRGLQISVVFMMAVLASGLLFAALFDTVSWSKGLALSSGFGWYSLSGTVMTESYGALWGSVALLNDLLREILALLFIPYVMRLSSSAAIGLAGVTSLDFTLPTLQKAGGSDIIPLVISFGFITNVVSPILMVLFSRW
ncbi:MAG: lysine exporter LysO family protein [Moraxella sp.]|nr:lysine exporter LysO family protein [Moraxella sp.]